MPRVPLLLIAIATTAMIACATEPPPRDVRPTAAPLVVSATSAPSPSASSAAPPDTATASKAELVEISAPTAEEGESRADKCKPEILASSLYAPGWLLTTDSGHAYAVEVETLKKGKDYAHHARIYNLASSRAKRVADIEARINSAALVGNEIVLVDYEADQLVHVPLDTRKPIREAPRPDVIARSAAGVLLRAKVSPEAVQVASPSATVAALPGVWDPQRVELAASATHVYLWLFPGGDASPTGPAWHRATLARATMGGAFELLGTKHLAGGLAAGGGFVFAGSLGSMLRMNEKTGEWQRAPNGGAETIVADGQGAAWTEGERGTVMYWPHGGKPFLACGDIAGAAAIAMNDKYIYFSAYGADLMAGGATLGRFPRPR